MDTFFVRLGAILAIVHVAQNNLEKMHFCLLSRNRALKVDLGTVLRDKYGYLFLSYFELFWLVLEVGQNKVQNMHVCWLSWN